jgi:vacuolar-type H+-ATPase catalytic subunit A/Vma1
MKLVNYALQNQIEYLSEEKSKQHFKEYLQSILEDTSSPFFKRCDYVGLSYLELKSRIDTLGKDIAELQALKKKLTSALDIAKTLTAEIFQQNGIDRMDGNIISSLTIQKSTTKEKNIINILDENKLMGLGFVKFSVDVEAVENHLSTKQGAKELKGLVEITPLSVTTPAKVKVNTKRVSANNVEMIETDEILIIEEQVA